MEVGGSLVRFDEVEESAGLFLISVVIGVNNEVSFDVVSIGKGSSRRDV